MASSPNLAMQLCTPRVVLDAVRGTPGVAGGGGGGGGWAGSQTSTAYWDFFYDLIANPTVASGWGRACVFDAAGRAAKTAELTGHWASHGVGMYSLHATAPRWGTAGYAWSRRGWSCCTPSRHRTGARGFVPKPRGRWWPPRGQRASPAWWQRLYPGRRRLHRRWCWASSASSAPRRGTPPGSRRFGGGVWSCE